MKLRYIDIDREINLITQCLVKHILDLLDLKEVNPVFVILYLFCHCA
jgi:hypothetical protein